MDATTVTDDRVRPESLEEFVGQTELVERLKIHIHAALISGRPLPHTLLAGLAGSGKSTLARIIANEMCDPIVIVPVAAKPRQILGEMLSLDHGGVVFFDEIQSYPKATQEALLPLLGEGSMTVNLVTWTFPRLTAIAATTEPQKIIQPLADRFAIRPAFENYSIDEMGDIVMGFAERLDVAIDPGFARGLGAASAGIPRIARSLLVAYRDLVAYGRTPSVADVLSFCGIHHDGLNDQHIEYLQVLLAAKGQAGLDHLAQRLRMSKQEVLRLESLLFDMGMIQTGGSVGRLLTQVGRERLREIS